MTDWDIPTCYVYNEHDTILLYTALHVTVNYFNSRSQYVYSTYSHLFVANYQRQCQSTIKENVELKLST